VNPPPSQDEIVYDESNLQISIPDNSPQGVEHKVEIDVDPSKKIVAMDLAIEIEHTYIGDLKVELFHPSGRSIVLHSNQGGGTNNLSIALTSDDLSEFIGLEAAGKYSLVVTDGASRDVGSIQSMMLKISMQ
jgi:subtilisin-like proprotein convertase family protein